MQFLVRGWICFTPQWCFNVLQKMPKVIQFSDVQVFTIVFLKTSATWTYLISFLYMIVLIMVSCYIDGSDMCNDLQMIWSFLISALPLNGNYM